MKHLITMTIQVEVHDDEALDDIQIHVRQTLYPFCRELDMGGVTPELNGTRNIRNYDGKVIGSCKMVIEES